jgi:hypothetical protein
MPDTLENKGRPTKKDPSKPSETSDDKKLDRIADDAAERAGKTEQRYDEDHNIFTK